MMEVRYRVSGELFKKILSHVDSLIRAELLELQAESKAAQGRECSQALYHVIQALDELAKVELINRDLMGNL